MVIGFYTLSMRDRLLSVFCIEGRYHSSISTKCAEVWLVSSGADFRSEKLVEKDPSRQ
jgi:hypothetical protein